MMDTQLAERKLVGWGAAEVAKEEVILKSPAELQRTSAKIEKASSSKDKIQALSLSLFLYHWTKGQYVSPTFHDGKNCQDNSRVSLQKTRQD